MYFTMHFLGQINRQIQSLGRQIEIIQRIRAVCLRYYAAHPSQMRPRKEASLKYYFLRHQIVTQVKVISKSPKPAYSRY